MYELVNMYKLVSLIVSHTKVSKLYFYKCTHFLLFLSLSTVLIHQFHSYTKIPTLIPRIPTLISHIPTLIPPRSHSDSQHSCHSPHSIPRFPIPTFTESLCR